MTDESERQMRNAGVLVTSIAGILITGFLGWIAVRTIATSESVIAIQTTMIAMQQRLDEAVNIQESLDMMSKDHIKLGMQVTSFDERLTRDEAHQEMEARRERKEHTGG